MKTRLHKSKRSYHTRNCLKKVQVLRIYPEKTIRKCHPPGPRLEPIRKEKSRETGEDLSMLS